MERPMLLVEQKTGLFDSVDQQARPVFIIRALADVKDNFNKAMLSFCGSKNLISAQSLMTVGDENQTIANSACMENNMKNF